MRAQNWLDLGRGEGGVLLAVGLVSAGEVRGRNGRDDEGGKLAKLDNGRGGNSLRKQ